MTNTLFGKTLKRARARADLTQQDLADRLGKSKSWVVNLELERTVPTDRDTIEQIARVLALNAATLRAQALHADLAAEGEWNVVWDELGESLQAQHTDDPIGPDVIQRCQPRSFDDIEKLAEEILESECPNAYSTATSIPIVELLKNLPNWKPGLKFEPSVEGGAALGPEGCTYYEEASKNVVVAVRQDVWSLAQEGDGRSRFTCAHELAHGLLHDLQLRQQKSRVFRDVACAASAHGSRPTGVAYYEWPEWQANTWASCFLMPRTSVYSFIEGRRIAGEDFSIEDMARHFEVSVQAARIRLEKVLPQLLSRNHTSG